MREASPRDIRSAQRRQACKVAPPSPQRGNSAFFLFHPAGRRRWYYHQIASVRRPSACGTMTASGKARASDMEITTSRFGVLRVLPSDILVFEHGLIGLRSCRRWVVLADAHNDALGWLQSVDDGDVALGVVSPRRFVADYQLRVGRHEIESLKLARPADAQVVVVVSRHPEGL
ncbi:MAG: hypothetical protein DCC67_18575, partial [Planctomycetota bacterium]